MKRIAPYYKLTGSDFLDSKSINLHTKVLRQGRGTLPKDPDKERQDSFNHQILQGKLVEFRFCQMLKHVASVYL